MSLKARTIAVAAAGCLLAGTAQAADGVLIVQKMTSGGTTQTNQVQIESHRMRADSTGLTGVKTIIIFDGTKQVMTTIDPEKKTYMEMTEADVDKIAEQMSGMMAQLQKQMESMPPAARAQMEAAMKGRGGAGTAPKIVYKKTGTDTVGKWKCDKYEGFDGEKKVSEVCTVDPKALGFALSDFDVTRQMAAFFKKMQPQASGQVFSIGTPEVEGYSGVPVRQVRTIVGREITTEISEVRRQSFPDSSYQVPAGYQKTDFMAGRGRGRQ
jgi:hypothetical protein